MRLTTIEMREAGAIGISLEEHGWANVEELTASFMDGNKIVVGRLQNEGCIKHSMLNDLKEHYEIAV